MLKIIKLVVLFLFCKCALCNISQCDKAEAIQSFSAKIRVGEWPSFHSNPYNNRTKESDEIIEQYLLRDHTTVCAIKYLGDKRYYVQEQFQNETSAEKHGFTVTHQGRCGACSNLKDLSVYLKVNLTVPVRRCAMFTFSFLIRRCLRNLGFTSQCTDIWLDNIKNTRWHCLFVCIWNRNAPLNKSDGTLNDCLQCDEDKSGAIFKYYAGRTRRNSGIKSEIYRPSSEIHKMQHCYY